MVIEIGKIISNQIINAVRPQHIKEQKQKLIIKRHLKELKKYTLDDVLKEHVIWD